MAPLDELSDLVTLHRAVDVGVARLAVIHGAALQCGIGCADCCVDDITVFEVEAALIQREHAELLRVAAPHPVGACAFLDEERRCRIYAHRPYVCRTHGMPLRWEDYDDDDEPIECRDICVVNDPHLEVTELAPELCWTIGPAEAQLRAAQARFAGESLRRVLLRDLFADSPQA